MWSYDLGMPRMFPWVIEAPMEEIGKWTALLREPSGKEPNGCSFAETSMARTGYRKLWLSQPSYQRLVEAGVVQDDVLVEETSDGP